MTEQPDDQQLWAALIAAEQERARRRAEFYQHARSRTETIARALEGKPWDQGVALAFLAALSDDVPAVLDRLIELSRSHRWGLAARQAIAPAWQSGRLPELPQKVIARLNRADDDEYRDLAALLKHLQAWEVLRELVKRAMASADPRIREVAEDLVKPDGYLGGSPGEDAANL